MTGLAIEFSIVVLIFLVAWRRQVRARERAIRTRRMSQMELGIDPARE